MSGSDYEVGYGKPPLHSRFAKGRSGNPLGSSRGRRDAHAGAKAAQEDGGFDDLILTELARNVRATENGAEVDISRFDALGRSLVSMGARGNRLAAVQAIAWGTKAAERQAHLCTQEYGWWSAFARRYRGLTLNYPLQPDAKPHYPHPADIMLSPANLGVTFLGPMDEVEARAFLLPRLIRDYILALAAHHERSASGSKGSADALLRLALLIHPLVPPSFGGRMIEQDGEADARAAGSVLLTYRQMGRRERRRCLANLTRAIEALFAALSPVHAQRRTDALSAIASVGQHLGDDAHPAWHDPSR